MPKMKKYEIEFSCNPEQLTVVLDMMNETVQTARLFGEKTDKYKITLERVGANESNG
jgi:hypothetical protein